MTRSTPCVVFDLDDTVFLERDYVRSGFLAVGAWAQDRLGVREFAEHAWNLFEAGRRGTIFDDVLRELSVEPTRQLVLDLVDVYRRHEPQIALLPDARVAIDDVTMTSPIAVITDGPIVAQRAKARALRTNRWAKPVVFTAGLGEGYGKPHPRAFELVERELGMPGPECAYVADNPAKDFLGPRNRGWRTVRVRRPESLHSEVPSGPDVDIEVVDLRGLAARLATVDG